MVAFNVSINSEGKKALLGCAFILIVSGCSYLVYRLKIYITSYMYFFKDQ